MLPFIPNPNICKMNVTDIIKWHHCHLLLHFGWEKPLHIHSRVMPTCLHIYQCPWPVSLTLPLKNHYVSFVFQFQHLWHSPPGILVCQMLQDVMLIWYTTTLETITMRDDCMTWLKMTKISFGKLYHKEWSWWLHQLIKANCNTWLISVSNIRPKA